MGANFLILSETHARWFSPLIKHISNPKIYRSKTPRNQLINRILKKNRIKNYTRKDFCELFKDILTTSEVFFLPLHIGFVNNNHCFHPEYKNVPKYKQFLERQLDKFQSTVIHLNELIYKPNFTPHAHHIWARSPAEYQVLLKDKKEISTVELIGDPSLKSVPLKSGDTLGIFTGSDRSRCMVQEEIFNEIIQDLNLASDKFKKIIVKPHPGDCREEYKPLLNNFAKKNHIQIEYADKWASAEDIGNKCDKAIVQSSISTHLLLRTLGVESFLYNSPKEKNWDYKFLLESGHPSCKLRDHINHNKTYKYYNHWIENTFLVEENRYERLLRFL